MGTYIARRLLLMIPTLIGITFLVFMLIALSPGGIGAGLRFAGGQMEASQRAIQEAYLEDRYGLNDPAVVQYVRWLGRISPIKFGTRDQVAPAGELIRAPKALNPPPLWRWYADALPDAEPPAFEFPSDATAAERERAYRAAAGDYAEHRGGYVAARAVLRQALVGYAKAAGVDEAYTSADELEPEGFEGHEPDPSLPEWAEVQDRGREAMDEYGLAVASRAHLAAVFAEKPFVEAGFPIIPGVLSVAAPDMGVAFSRSRPVMDLIKTALPVTLLLNFVAFPIIYLIAVPTGVRAATHRGGPFDAASGALFLALWSVPVVWAGTLAIGYLASNQYLGWFPVSGLHDSSADAYTFFPRWWDGRFTPGYLLDAVWHLVLPVACLVYAGFAVLSKQTRAAMLDNFNADYVRTAKAKGVAGRDVVMRHVFRNSLLPLITMAVSIFPAMLAGSVVVERIFTIPGMGLLLLDAINLRDRELILANTLMIAGLNLVALLLADILYAMADPRVSYD